MSLYLLIKRLIKVEHTLLSLVVVMIYCGIIFFLSSLPGILLPHPIIGFDKVLHIIAYTGLGFLSYQVMVNYKKGQKISFLILMLIPFIFCLLYGISDEIHQSFVPGRDPDVYDVIADGIGSSIGIFVYHRLLI